MKDDQKDQNSSEVGREHRAIPSSESAIISKLDAAPSPRPWQWLPNDGQFVVDASGNLVGEIPCQGCNPLDGELIVRAVNAHDALVAALSSVTRELDEIVNVTSRAIDQCKGNFASRMVPSFLAIEEARAALALANTQDTNTLASSGKSSPTE